jgi:small subunit ribosomal protein S18
VARPPRRAPKDATRRTKKKVCVFCKDHIAWVDYKDVNLLRRFMSDRGKIRARRVTGNCAQHQREVAVAIKTARELALLPYTQRTVTERAAPRQRPVVEVPTVREEVTAESEPAEADEGDEVQDTEGEEGAEGAEGAEAEEATSS